MARPRTKQRKLLEKAFNDNYHRKVNAPFGVLASPRNFKHDGVDYGVDEGEPIYPIHDNVEVTRVVNNVNRNYKSTTYSEKDFGNYIIYYIPAWNVSVLYAHLQKIEVGVGKHGYKRFGRVGNTGLSTGPHLHLGFAKGKHSTLSSIRKNGIDFEGWSIPNSKPKITNKLINDVILGKYGNGTERKRRLEEAGYNYNEVQDLVNRSYGAKPQAKPKPKPQTKPKPKPKPQTKVGKWANFKGNVRLFIKSRGDGCYPIKNGVVKNNVHTNVRATSAKILDEDNGRVLVSVPRFNPNRVWIANSESTVSDSPKYKL